MHGNRQPGGSPAGLKTSSVQYGHRARAANQAPAQADTSETRARLHVCDFCNDPIFFELATMQNRIFC